MSTKHLQAARATLFIAHFAGFGLTAWITATTGPHPALAGLALAWAFLSWWAWTLAGTLLIEINNQDHQIQDYETRERAAYHTQTLLLDSLMDLIEKTEKENPKK